MPRQYADKSCADCGVTFTPLGGRSTRCAQCQFTKTGSYRCHSCRKVQDTEGMAWLGMGFCAPCVEFLDLDAFGRTLDDIAHINDSEFTND